MSKTVVRSNWKKVKIGDILSKKPRSHPKVKTSEYLSKGKYPVVDQGRSFISGYSDDDSCLYNGDLPVVIFGDHTRMLKYIDFNFAIGADGTQVLIPDQNLFTTRYFYYTLENLNFKNYGYERHFKHLKEQYISQPPLPIQQKVASTLSAYDDLIETNDRLIKILEEMARLIYKEWFVKFRFPGYGRVKMVKSTLGMIPEGWEVNKIGKILLKLPRRKKVKKGEYIEDGEIPIIDQGRDFIGGYTNDIETRYTEPLPIIVFGDHTRIVKYIDFPFASGADGTQLMYPKGENLTPLYLYFVLKNLGLSNYAYARHFKYLKEKDILAPKVEIVHRFNRCTSVLLNQMSLLRKQNQKLREVRDMLLPKLISGEIEVEI